MRVFLLLLCLHAALPLQAANPSVVIIGGGPAGLATAIEAHERGLDVCLVEMRASYSREQTLFLQNFSLELLEKWHVDTTPIKVIDTGDGNRLGIIALKALEATLHARFQELHIPKIQGEFLALEPVHKIARILCEGEKKELSYDILVGADGCHSVVRQAAGIWLNHFGQASAISAFIPLPHNTMQISDTIQKGDLFIKRIITPVASIVFAQSCTQKQFSMEDIARTCGWEEEAALVHAGKAHVKAGIEVHLQQAAAFSDVVKGVILVGDAAACASYLDGKGANTAFLTASAAGEFFTMQQQQNSQAYSSFDNAMQEITDELIEASRYLFSSA